MQVKSLRWVFTCNEIDWDSLCKVYEKAPLGNKTPKELKIAFENSMFKCFLYDKDNLIGAGRAMADGIDCSYICDVALLPNYQNLGLGKQIMQKLLYFSKDHRKIILYSVVGKEEFYEKLGFKPMKTAMAKFKKEKEAFIDGYIGE